MASTNSSVVVCREEFDPSCLNFAEKRSVFLMVADWSLFLIAVIPYTSRPKSSSALLDSDTNRIVITALWH